VRVGVPMMGFMIGGCYVLSEFMQTHMEMKDKKVSSQTVRKFDLEEEHKTMMSSLELEKGYKLSRIPRPEDAPPQAKSLQGLNQANKAGTGTGGHVATEAAAAPPQQETKKGGWW